MTCRIILSRVWCKYHKLKQSKYSGKVSKFFFFFLFSTNISLPLSYIFILMNVTGVFRYNCVQQRKEKIYRLIDMRWKEGSGTATPWLDTLLARMTVRKPYEEESERIGERETPERAASFGKENRRGERSNEGEGGHDTAPLLKSTRVACYYATVPPPMVIQAKSMIPDESHAAI